jgi:hypothetical protein
MKQVLRAVYDASTTITTDRPIDRARAEEARARAQQQQEPAAIQSLWLITAGQGAVVRRPAKRDPSRR